MSEFLSRTLQISRVMFSKVKHYEVTKCFKPVIEPSIIALLKEYNVMTHICVCFERNAVECNCDCEC
jgi:hypothetical protein